MPTVLVADYQFHFEKSMGKNDIQVGRISRESPAGGGGGSVCWGLDFGPKGRWFTSRSD